MRIEGSPSIKKILAAIKMSILFHFLFAYILGKFLHLDMILILIGSVLPDLDYILWKILDSRKSEKLSYTHRVYFHNIFFILFSSFLPYSVFIGVVAHIFMDLFEGGGAPVLSPIIKRDFLIKKVYDGTRNPFYADIVGGNSYLFIFLLILSLIAYFFY